LIDIKKVTWWTGPFVVFGVNALALFVGSGMLGRVLNLTPAGTNAEGKAIPLKSVIFDSVFAPLGSEINASLMFAIATVLVWLFLMWAALPQPHLYQDLKGQRAVWIKARSDPPVDRHDSASDARSSLAQQEADHGSKFFCTHPGAKVRVWHVCAVGGGVDD
jgi:hypothetical protein